MLGLCLALHCFSLRSSDGFILPENENASFYLKIRKVCGMD